MDIDEQVKQQTKILEDLTNIENSSVSTKKEYITKLKDVTRPLILSGYYPDVTLSDFCSFISGLLEKHNISYSRTSLNSLFEDNEKRVKHTPKNFLKEEVTNSPPQEPSEGLTGKLDFLEKAIGKSYDHMDNYDAADKLYQLELIAAKAVSHIKSFTKKLFQANYFINSFEKQFSVEEAEKIAEGLPKKQRQRLENLIAIYHTSILLISEMETNLADIETKEMQAKQKIISRDIDERNKLSTWEKLMIVLVMKAEGIAKNQCARLTGIDKKHITNNIYPKVSPTETATKNKHHDYISYFKNITIKLGGKQYTFDITRWFEEQIERKKLDLEFKPLVVENAKVL